jgi:glutamate carboxypeptidase
MTGAAMDVRRARSFFEALQEDTLQALETLVKINSFTTNREGVNRNATLIEGFFAPMGFESRRVPSKNPECGDHLALARRGRSDRRIVLVSHLDTVFSPEEEAANGFRWREEGPRIYGPGTNDIKGGTVLIRLVMEGLRDLAPEVYEGISWTVLLNASEEHGSEDFPDLAREEAEGALACLVYEAGYPSAAGSTVVVSRKGSARFGLRVRGRAAHSGSRHERGASAVVELADKILKVAALTDYARGVTTNVGVIRGGTVANTVPAFAEALVDLRARDPESFDEAKRRIRELAREATVRSAEDGFPCSLELEEHPDYPPMPRNEGTDRLFALAQDSARELGLTIEGQARGGASDACHLWRTLPTLDGLGPVGDNAHCSQRSPDGTRDQEYVLRDSFVERALLSLGVILRIGKIKP